MTTAVLDTNVYISAIIFGGNPRKIIKLAIEKDILLYSSPKILLEVAQKLHKKFSWKESKAKAAIIAISKISQLIHPKQVVNLVKTNPTDNMIIECALEAKAAYIVTGDKHLLSIKSAKGIKILTPAEFLREVMKNSTQSTT